MNLSCLANEVNYFRTSFQIVISQYLVAVILRRCEYRLKLKFIRIYIIV